jgi:hypothetical protein
MTPSKNDAWKAMKFWGYFSPSQTGYYKLGANSDDGAYGYLIVNGQTTEFVNDWSIASAFNRTDNNSIYLTANSCYPIYMEWYEGCPTNAAFTPVYQYSSSSGTSGFSNWANIPQNYFYSSKTTTPGTIPGAYFGDVSGIPFPTQDGVYYIATKFVSGEGTTSGLYGPFIIDTTPPTISNLSVVSNNSSSNKKAVAGNTLTINFTASETLQGNPQILINGYVANATYTNISGNNYTATVNIGNDASIDSSGDKITNGPINVQIAHYSDLSGNTGSTVQDNSVTFVSNDLGITLALTQTPTTLTNANVTVTANATAYGNGNNIKTMKYASGSQSVNYFTAGGPNLTLNTLPSSNNTNGILQSPVQSGFNVNTNGVYTVYATDTSGNVAVQTIDIENIFVAAPVITSPTSGTTTNINTPTIKGTGEAGATVTVYDNGTAIGTAIVDSNGNWSLTPATGLADGTHAITATQKDAAGNVSPVSNTVNITIQSVIVQTKAKLDLSRALDSANSTVKIGDTFAIDYTITPEDINVSDIYPNGGTPSSTYSITASNFSYEDVFPTGLTPVNKRNDSQLTINNQTVNGTLNVNNIVYTLDSSGTVYEAQPITFKIWLKADVQTPQQYLLDGTKSIITYMDSSNTQNTANFPNLSVNVNGNTSILRLGAYMKNNPSSNYIYQGTNGQLNAVKSIPMDMAMSVDIESYNPEIDLSIVGPYISGNITFTKYNLDNNNVIVPSSMQSTSSSSMVLKNNPGTFDLQLGNKYIIVYSITPNGNKGDTINIKATLGDQTSYQNVILNIQDLPNLE